MKTSQSTKEKKLVGRPLAFKTVKELQDKIDEYFEWCDNRTKKIWMEKTQTESLIADPAPYTMSGLARRLAFLPELLISNQRVHEQ